MPGYDGTGPIGQGAMTGRGFGSCATGVVAGRRFLGFGRGRGAGRALGFRRRVSAVDSYISEPKEELSTLKQEAEYIKRDLNNVETRIKELEKE
jgi:hypothetical protein